MITKTKLLKEINHDQWNKFVGYCRVDGKKVSNAINDFIEDFLTKRENKK